MFRNKLLYIALLLFVVCSSTVEGAEYVQLMRSAIDKASQGLTRESFALVSQAMDHDPDDPLAHAVLGYIYSIGGKTKEAELEYAYVLKKDPNRALAAYGLGLLELNNGKPEDALVSLTKAQSLDPKLNMRGTLEYVKFLCTNSVKDFSAIDSVSKVVQAYGVAGTGQNAEALTLLEQSLLDTGILPYKENIGLTASFDIKKPVGAKGWPLRKTDVMRSLKDRKIQLVKGKLTLKVDMRRAGTIQMVSFLIDNRVACITNQHPFEYVWDTTRGADGFHVITIQGNNEATALVSSKSTKVFVRNLSSGTAALNDAAGYAKAWQELWEAVRLKPSLCAINYQIAVCAMELGNNQKAEEALENVMAINPDYKDTRSRLKKLRDISTDDIKVYKSRSGNNKVALTFDDGPGVSIPVVLRILKQHNVKATFFVVGKQVETYPDILKSIHSDGHEVQNHTFYHSALSFLKESDIEKEYFSTSSAVRNVIGIGTSCIRPPGGRSGEELYRFLRQYGVKSILWTINCVPGEGTTAEKLTKYVTKQIRPGAIILMHHGDTITQRALPKIIQNLRSQRYEFVTISDFLAK